MSSNKIVLISKDGESFEIDEKVARKMVTISHMIDDDCVDAPIPLQNAVCTGDILALVIEYSKNICDQEDKVVVDSTEAEDHVEKAKEVDDHVEKVKGKEDDVEKGKGKGKEVIWDATDFMNNLDRDTILKVIIAASFLNIQGLLDLSCQKIADNIKDLELEEIRNIFGIENDFTEAEEAAVREKNAWAFEKTKP